MSKAPSVAEHARRAELFDELLSALELLYFAYCCEMRSEYDYPGNPWTPERDGNTAAIVARDTIAKAIGTKP